MRPQPRRTTVVRWRCPFCTWSRSERQATVDHIARCWANPENRACRSCRHHQRAQDGYCGARPGCRCQDIPEACLAGVSLAEGIRVGCPEWEGVE